MSPPSLSNCMDHQRPMGSSPPFRNSSEERFWTRLRSRVDNLVAEKRKRSFRDEDLSLHEQKNDDIYDGNSNKRMKEGDSLLLLRGLDSVASSLSQLTSHIDSALQGAMDLNNPRLTELLCSRDRSTIKDPRDTDPKMMEDKASDGEPTSLAKGKSPLFGEAQGTAKLRNAQNLASTMATKAASLAKELQSIKADLLFMKERCSLLEEENRRLHDGIAKGIRPDEDDLVRLQLEALLAEKSRLANENANLTRENQCLHQLVEYHQLTMQDFSASSEDPTAAIHGSGLYLDFSSPTLLKEVEGADDRLVENGTLSPSTPTAHGSGGLPIDNVGLCLDFSSPTLLK